MNRLLQSLRPALVLILLLCLPVPATAQTPPVEGPGVRTYVVEGETLIEWYARENEIFFLQISDANDHLKRWTWAPVIETGLDDFISYEFGGDTPKGFARLHYTTGVLPEGETLESWDLDEDGLSNFDEITIHQTNPLKADTDGDGLSDGWEVANGLDPNDPTGDNGADGDPDNDGVNNIDERLGNTDPRDEDDFPLQLLGISRGASGLSAPHNGQISWYQQWGEDPEYGTETEAGLTLTPALLAGKAALIPFPAEPPLDEPGVEVNNWDLSRPSVLSVFTMSGDGAIRSGNVKDGRFRLRAPAVDFRRTFRCLKITSNSAFVGNATSATTTIESVEVEDFIIPANEEYSLPVDLRARAPMAADTRNTTIVSLIPVVVKDLRDDGDEDDLVIDPLSLPPVQEDGEADAAFWTRRNAWLQEDIDERSIAWIDPHRGAGQSPDMPRLVARLHGGGHDFKVRWRLEVEYLRGNGYRAGYVQDFTRPEDKVRIPHGPQGGVAYTDAMEQDEAWEISGTEDWFQEIQQRGFFGGTGKIYIWPEGLAGEPSEPAFTFRIGGRNPDQQAARNYIDAQAGETFWYAYAIARHETFGRVRVGGQIRYYNQFCTEYRGGPIGDAAVDMGLVAWAKGWPLYNLDRYRDRNGVRQQNGPGGYGMYQLTWGPKTPNGVQGTGSSAFIPRRMIWNWQENTLGAIGELQGKLTAAQGLYNGLRTTYSQWPDIPDEGHLSGLEAIVVTYYNGTGGLPSWQVGQSQRRTCWTPRGNAQNRIWRFHQNSQNYVQSVNNRINNAQP